MHERWHRFLSGLVVAALCGAAATLAQAETAGDVNALIRSLAPIEDQTIAPSPVPTELHGATVLLSPEASVDIEVYFARNSTMLTDKARAELGALGQALSSETLLPFRYLIAGHTDATGPAAFNQALSEGRAESVRAFLIDTFVIDPERLESVGWGESRLKDPSAPTAAVNRRVEITLIVPPGGYPEPVDNAGPPKSEDAPPPGTLQPDGSGGIKIAF